MLGLILIAVGSGGIKPCVSAHVGTNSVIQPSLAGKSWLVLFCNQPRAAVSTVLTPWLLRTYGPAYAFGIPGVLMVIATILFWMGRNKFIHIPAAGGAFIKEVFSKEGLGSSQSSL